MYDNGEIDEKTIEYLIPDSPKPGRFNLLPKIHKANNRGRPIVSANGHPTEKISGLVDFHLRQHNEALPSFIKNTTDYLQQMAAQHYSDHYGCHLLLHQYSSFRCHRSL